MTSEPDSPSGASLAFWVHQALEYLLAAFVASSAIRLDSRAMGVCLVAAAALLALAALSRGPLGVVKVVPLPLHRVLDFVFVVVLATSPAWLGLGWTSSGTIIIETVAVAALLLTRATSFRPKPSRRATSAPPSFPSPSSPSGDGGEAVTRAAGAAARQMGRAVGVAKQHGPRAAGRALGRFRKRPR
jgi:hypothetical protein